jgi:hypothetical protein
MKRNLTKWMAIAVLLFPILASAELIHYKGTRRDVSHGDGRSLSINSKVFMVVDSETANTTLIQYAAMYGQKRYALIQLTNMHFVRTSGSQNTYTAIAHPISDCDRESGRTGEGAFCTGVDAQLTLKTGSSYTFPKLFKASGQGVSFPTPGNPVLVEGWFQVVYDRAATVTSNEDSESFDDAVDRLVHQLETQGYSR